MYFRLLPIILRIVENRQKIWEKPQYGFLLSTHQQLFLLLPMEPDDKEADPVLGQALPGSDEVHLCLQQVEVLHIGVGLKDLLTQLKYGCYF